MTAKIYDDGSSYCWTPEMGKDGIIIRISKSTAGSIGWCVQQMWLEQNYRKPQGLVKHLVLGDDVHNGLDLFYQHIEKKPHLIKTIKHLAKNKADMSEYLTKMIPTEKTIIENRRAENKDFPFYHEDYYRNMKWLMEFENARMKMNPKNPMPLANEVRIEVKIDMDIVGYGIVPVQFVGIIDRVFEAEDGGLMLYELKTGKWKDNKATEMRKEMAYYKFLIENCDSAYLQERGIDRPVTHWGWRYSAADHWMIEPVKKVSERAMMKRLNDLIKMYLDNHFPPTKQDFKCGYCNYLELCPKYAIEVSE
jgi:hypothetical protein